MGSEHSSVLLGRDPIEKASQLLRPFMLAGVDPHPGVHPHGHVLGTDDCLVWAWGNATGDMGVNREWRQCCCWSQPFGWGRKEARKAQPLAARVVKAPRAAAGREAMALGLGLLSAGAARPGAARGNRPPGKWRLLRSARPGPARRLLNGRHQRGMGRADMGAVISLGAQEIGAVTQILIL